MGPGDSTATMALLPRAMRKGDPTSTTALSPPGDGRGGINSHNGHVPQSSILDGFAEAVVTMLTPGVNACVAKAKDQEGSPNKRQRADGQQA